MTAIKIYYNNSHYRKLFIKSTWASYSFWSKLNKKLSIIIITSWYIEKYLVIHKDDIIRALEIVAEMNNLYVILAFEHEMSKILYVVCTIIFIRFAI